MMFPPRGLYAITHVPAAGPVEDLAGTAAQILAGGAVVLQYRDKVNDAGRRLAIARALKQVTERYTVPFIINDDPALANAVDAAGVHLGKQDCDLPAARGLLGADRIIGVSCYDSLELALRAEEDGADYVAFGSFFSSATKPDAARAPLELLQRAKAGLHVPIVAIGGITPDNGQSLLQAGASHLAVIRGLLDEYTPRQAAARYARLFDN